jgi:2-keto-4-pentenoate hydratase/2-oxohepta-3-ene-1,7-dioic acid hydratase in catechol pathway
MRFSVVRHGGHQFVGVRQGDCLVDLARLDSQLPADMLGVLAGGAHLAEKVSLLLNKVPAADLIPLSEIEWCLPISRPSKFICIGLNYHEHAREAGMDIPDYPSVFARFPTSLVANESAIICPSISSALDYEAELAVVIGKRGHRVPLAHALELVGGYSVFNDGSLRDYQNKTTQWGPGKNFDATGGFGPEIVTPDELPAGAAGLSIMTLLNGQVVQQGNTGDMIFSVAQAITLLSEFMTLEPGDVIAMGTPSGVGVARTPQLFMKHGDVCEVKIEGIGTLRNPIVNEVPVVAAAMR